MSDKKKNPPKDDKKDLRKTKAVGVLNTPWKKSELLAEKAVRTVEKKGLTAHRKLKQFTQGSISKKRNVQETEDLRSVLHFAKALSTPMEDTEEESKSAPAEPVRIPSQSSIPSAASDPTNTPLAEKTQMVRLEDLYETDPIYPVLRKGAGSYNVQEGKVITGMGAEIPDVETTQQIRPKDLKKPKKK